MRVVAHDSARTAGEAREEAPSASTLALLEAVAAISSDLDLRAVLARIVDAATRLTGARYGALGVIGNDSFLAEFVATGVSEEQRARIGSPPQGHGILGELIRDPHPMRLDDLTEDPRAAGFPAHHPPMRTFLGVPIRIRGTVFGNLYLAEKQGGHSFTAHDELLVEALASTAGFVIDNARAYGVSERRRQWLEASAELSDALQPPIELGRALSEVAAAARAMSHAAGAAVLRMEHGSAVHTLDCDPDAQDGVAAALELLESEPWPTSDAAPTHRLLGGYVATLVPLRTHLVAAGLLVIIFEPGTPPVSVDERALMVSFADQAGLALDRAQAIEDRAEHAVTADRERIARDLHDLVIQRLFATGLQLQGVAAMAGDPSISDRVDQAVESLDLTIKDIRGTIFELQQRHHGPSLRSDLRHLAQEYAPLLKFDPVVRTTGPVDTAVPVQVREQLLPVLREALSNLARHAAADRGSIELSVDEREVRLTVTDNGVGIAPDAAESGLRNARRRATSLGGSLELHPHTPRGTTFVWRVPLTSTGG